MHIIHKLCTFAALMKSIEMSIKKIQSALISVYNKEGLDPILKNLKKLGVEIISTGGTQKYIEKLGINVKPVEELTDYPSILGGRVKTLHPKVFGGILNRRDHKSDQEEVSKFGIPSIDLIIVDLYPFEETVKAGGTHDEIIEKIDIGGIALIRGAAKNYNDVIIISSKDQYNTLQSLLESDKGSSSLADRINFAKEAFMVSSHYDTHIFNYFNRSNPSDVFKESVLDSQVLRYGENPHQKGVFHGDLSDIFEKRHGKELSYNNLLDVDAAVNLMEEFKNDAPTFAILKHNNACGVATRSSLEDAFKAALAGDPVSAFGGILIANAKIDLPTAEHINKLFCEVVIAPAYDTTAEELLRSKKNRIILIQKPCELPKKQHRSILNGVLSQDKDQITDQIADFKTATKKEVTSQEATDLFFANKLAKHTKSNTIVLVKNNQLLASGTGQTSRVDALNQAIHKAKSFDFDLNGAVMASDAFFPFPDCVEIANNVGIKAIIQPGGSIKDQLSIDFCNEHEIGMVFTGNRHFKH